MKNHIKATSLQYRTSRVVSESLTQRVQDFSASVKDIKTCIMIKNLTFSRFV